MGVTLNSRRDISPLVRLVEGKEGWEASNHPNGIIPQNKGGTNQNRTVSPAWCSNLAPNTRSLAWVFCTPQQQENPPRILITIRRTTIFSVAANIWPLILQA
ncbi:hypothetical protein TNCV_4592201 [Trichonephila clavipes]|nr:hypothetical protein TNCV_4592201 [Trichonephila clavipes]